MRDQLRDQSGVALVLVLLLILVILAVGVFALLSVDRNTEMRAAYQRSVAGFHAAEAGANVGAGEVRNIFLGFNTPSDCSPKTLTINDRTVTYQLGVPGRAAGDCTPPDPVPQVTIPAGDPYEGLTAQLYTYNLRSEARNAQGHTEAIVNIQFNAYLIPMFQFASFYKEDLELTVGPPMVINGRMHTNKDMYLNTGYCDPGLRILGHLTIVGDLYRGRKDSNRNYGKVRISLDGTLDNLRTLGTTRGSESCSQVARRLVPDDEVAQWNGRIRTDLVDISLPGQQDFLCAPWSCPPGQQPGSYWQKADLRIVLDADPTDGDGRASLPGGGPLLWPVKVYNADGTVNATLTNAVRTLLVQNPGIITYNDVPIAGASPNENPDCRTNPNCEASVYSDPDNYSPALKCTSPDGTRQRRPRVAINGLPATASKSNYCNDYRYGGFYNWRESKPILMLNIDWMALEEWNQQQPAGSRLFDPNDTTEGGLVIFLSVKGPNSRGANNYGVRIYDAQRVRRSQNSPGVTFASDVAFYVAGNFNCADPEESVQESGAPMPCGPGDPADRTIGKRPAAIVADTINILSCAWMESGSGDPWDGSGPCRSRFNFGTDERNPASWGHQNCDGERDQKRAKCPYRPRDELSTPSGAPTARRTVVNAAFLAGNDLTWCPGNDNGVDCGYDWYSGGLENYPRFHECWAFCNTANEYLGRFWYEGSLVALEHPKHTCWGVQRGWVADDPNYSCRTYERQGFWRRQRYSPPQRRWFYDVSFNDARNLPPLSPRFVYLTQNFFTEEVR